MRRKLTPKSSLDNLKREAKRWLKALHANDVDARTRLRTAHPDAHDPPKLRDVQYALAREYGFSGWAALKDAVTAGSAPDAPRTAGITALLAAADRGDAAAVAELLDAHPDIVSERGVLSGHTGLRTALHFAVGSTHEHIVKLLLDRGADPNVRDEGDNAMPLHFAAEKEHLAIIRLLIEHGADPIGEGDGHELDIIGWATCFGTGSKDVVDYLLAHGARHNIFSAVAMGDTSEIRALATRSADLLDRRMDQTNHARRPLHLAIVKRQPDALATLLDLGADVEIVDASGLTPLDQAALADEKAMAERLLDRGASIHLPAAVALGRTEEIERLLREEPDSLKPGGRWATLIVRAAERSTGPVIEALIRAGASVDAVDDTKTSVDSTASYTALHAAAFAGNSQAVAVLMKYGANVRARDGRFCGTPAGWANYAGHAEARDLILTGLIDPFEAIDFGLTHRIADILDRDPGSRDRRFGEYAACGSDRRPDPSFTPLMWALEKGNVEAANVLVERGAVANVRDASGGEAQAARVSRFLEGACLDWRVGGSQRAMRMHDAARLLRRHSEIARDNLYTAVACGDIEHVERLLAARPASASEMGGPHRWPPLLYLCSARLPIAATSENAVEIARALLDNGADPNAYYFGGEDTIHYTALTCVLGRGEEQASTHPQAEPLARLLLERGAEPYDSQVLYNVFADHASRKKLGDDIIWFLDLMYTHAMRRGREADWKDPTWTMLEPTGYRPAARHLLGAAVDGNHLKLAEWMLKYGASPNAPPSSDPHQSQLSMYERAMRRGFTQMAELLVRFGARTTMVTRDGYDAFVAACFRLDRAAALALAGEHPEYLLDHRAMFEAANQNRADVAELLLDLGVSPDVGAGDGGRRALHVAASSGAVDVARMLIERGADVDSRETSYNSIPLGVASWAQQPRMIELLARYSRDIWELVYTGRVERVRELVLADPGLAKVTSSDGDTPLMWLPNDDTAALAIVQLLLANGADQTVRDKQGRTAADIALERGMDDVADLLGSAGAVVSPVTAPSRD